MWDFKCLIHLLFHANFSWDFEANANTDNYTR